MRNLTQTENGVKNSSGQFVRYGNCLQTCIACILDLDVNQVPNIQVFYGIKDTDQSDQPMWLSVLNQWLFHRGLEMVVVDVKKNSIDFGSDWFIARGISAASGDAHSICMHVSKPAWDPSPAREGLKEFTHYYFIKPLLANENNPTNEQIAQIKMSAERVVLCVNKCAGLTNEQIERLPEIIDEREYFKNELNQIRRIISADENESTFDEVMRLLSRYNKATKTIEDFWSVYKGKDEVASSLEHLLGIKSALELVEQECYSLGDLSGIPLYDALGSFFYRLYCIAHNALNPGDTIDTPEPNNLTEILDKYLKDQTISKAQPPSMKGKWFKYIEGSIIAFTSNKWYECLVDNPLLPNAFRDNELRPNSMNPNNDKFFDLSNPMDYNPDEPKPEPKFVEVPYSWDKYMEYRDQGAYFEFYGKKMGEPMIISNIDSSKPNAIMFSDRNEMFTKEGVHFTSLGQLKLFIPATFIPTKKTITVWAVVNECGNILATTGKLLISNAWKENGSRVEELTKEVEVSHE